MSSICLIVIEKTNLKISNLYINLGIEYFLHVFFYKFLRNLFLFMEKINP